MVDGGPGAICDVVCHGELLLDLVPTVSGVGLADAPAFKSAPGGAPANVAVGLARLGLASRFMGMVGDDAFGRYLRRTLASAGVDVSGLRFTGEAPTGLAFVALRADGEREFLFYRQPSADMLFAPHDVDAEAIERSRAFHFGSISLIAEPARSATLRALEFARQAKRLVSYDPNLRLDLWRDPDAARTGIALGWRWAQIIKLSADELTFLAGTDDLAAAARQLWHPELRLLVATLGARGCRYFSDTASGEVPGFEVDAVDTTGAGDGFMAGLLCGWLGAGDAPEGAPAGAPADGATLRAVCRYANAVGALTTTERGAIPALPDGRRVAALLAGRPAGPGGTAT